MLRPTREIKTRGSVSLSGMRPVFNDGNGQGRYLPQHRAASPAAPGCNTTHYSIALPLDSCGVMSLGSSNDISRACPNHNAKLAYAGTRKFQCIRLSIFFRGEIFLLKACDIW